MARERRCCQMKVDRSIDLEIEHDGMDRNGVREIPRGT